VKSGRVIDCFMYSGETDAVSIRFDEQLNEVDEYWVIESNRSFTGIPKVLRFHADADANGWDLSKVRYLDISDQITVTEDPWKVERTSRNIVSEYIDDLKKHDKLIISDADEIISQKMLSRIRGLRIGLPIGLHLRPSYLYLNYCLLEPLWAANLTTAVVLTKELLNQKTADDWRKQIQMDLLPYIRISSAGWHASFLGGVQAMRTKMSFYSHTEFGVDVIPIDIDISELVRQGRDLLGRDGFKFELISKDDLPMCVKTDSEKYRHLIYEAQ